MNFATTFEGHRISGFVRWRECGKSCSGCPHPSVIVEVTTPSGTKRQLTGEPPRSSGRRRGPKRTRRIDMGTIRAPEAARRSTIRRTRGY